MAGDGIRIIRCGIEDVMVFLVEVVVPRPARAFDRMSASGLVEHGELPHQLGSETPHSSCLWSLLSGMGFSF
jgi:hypothetical protein